MSQAKERLGKTVTVRNAPAVRPNNDVSFIGPWQIVDYEKIVDDVDFPANPSYEWLKLDEGRYANFIYPPAGKRFDLLNDPPPPPPPSDSSIDHIDAVFTDGHSERFVPE